MGHSAKVQKLLYTPDGKKIISVSEDKTIRVWDALTGEMVQKLETEIGDGPEGMLYTQAISPDGKHLAVSGYPVNEDFFIAIIDLSKNIQIGVARGHTNVINALAYSGDGKFLISGSDDGTIKIYKSDSFKEVQTLTVAAPVKDLSVNVHTGDIAVVAEGKKDIAVYNLLGAEQGAMKPKPKYIQKHKGELNKIAYSPDGEYFASSSFTNEFLLWRKDGSLVKDLSTGGLINAIAFSPDGKLLVGLDNAGRGTSFSISAGNQLATFSGHDNTVFSAAFSPVESGSYLVASAGGINNEIILWNPINGRSVKTMRGKGRAIQNLAFGKGLELYFSSEVAAAGQQVIKFKSGFDFLNLKLTTSAADVKAPGKSSRLYQASETILDLPKGKSVTNDIQVDGRILTYQQLSDGRVLVGSDYSLKLYDPNAVLIKEFIGHSSGVRALALSADGNYFASGGEDQTIILWRLDDSGSAPSIRQHPAFNTPEWTDYFTSLPVDSLTYKADKKSWKAVIDFLKQNGDRAGKALETEYNNLGELVNPYLTLFVADDGEWVCWVPKGYFSCSSHGSNYFGWHINRGSASLADYYSADQYFEILYRPKELQKSIASGKRVEDIIREDGGRVFDLTRLHKPSAAVFNYYPLISAGKLKGEAGQLKTDEKTLDLEIDVFDGGGGVKEVNVYHNDKLIINDKDIRTVADKSEVKKTYTVELTNDVNEFRLVAVNFQKIESKAQILKIQYTGKVMATSSLHMLVVGINKYKNAAYNLNYAQPDAVSIAEKITSESARLYKGVNKIEIYDENATKEKIMSAFKLIAEKAKPEDAFIFFYAGHGSLDEDNKDKDGNSPFYFVPTDVTKIYGDPEQLRAKGVSGGELQESLKNIKAMKQIVLMDACHSGAAIKNMNVRAVASDEKAIIQLARSAGVVWIASSGSKQFATEFETLKHGVFTYSLLEALSGKAGNGDNKITVNELKFYMEERVPELTHQYGGQAQYPTGFINGNDFPIVVFGEGEQN